MFNCQVSQECNGVCMTLLNKDFKNLKEICVELGLSYHQVGDISSRNGRKDYQKFKYYPKIQITRIIKSVKDKDVNGGTNDGGIIKEN